MISKIFSALVAAVIGIAAPAAATEQFTGGSFDMTPVAAISGQTSGPGYVYPGATLVDGWQFLTNAGIIDGVTATPWFGGSPPQGFEGPQYAFVQSTGALAQHFTATHSGLLTVSWLEGSRPAIGGSTGNQNYDLLLGSDSFGLFQVYSGQNFVARSASLGPVTAGNNYRFVFRGLATNDGTVFIDSVSATITPAGPAVPEPSTWLLLVAGFGLTGLVARRRRPRAVLVSA